MRLARRATLRGGPHSPGAIAPPGASGKNGGRPALPTPIARSPLFLTAISRGKARYPIRGARLTAGNANGPENCPLKPEPSGFQPITRLPHREYVPRLRRIILDLSPQLRDVDVHR